MAGVVIYRRAAGPRNDTDEDGERRRAEREGMRPSRGEAAGKEAGELRSGDTRSTGGHGASKAKEKGKERALEEGAKPDQSSRSRLV